MAAALDRGHVEGLADEIRDEHAVEPVDRCSGTDREVPGLGRRARIVIAIGAPASKIAWLRPISSSNRTSSIRNVPSPGQRLIVVAPGLPGDGHSSYQDRPR